MSPLPYYNLNTYHKGQPAALYSDTVSSAGVQKAAAGGQAHEVGPYLGADYGLILNFTLQTATRRPSGSNSQWTA